MKMSNQTIRLPVTPFSFPLLASLPPPPAAVWISQLDQELGCPSGEQTLSFSTFHHQHFDDSVDMVLDQSFSFGLFLLPFILR